MNRQRSWARCGLFSCCLVVGLTAAPLAALEFGLFGDLTFTDSDAPESPSSFALGVLDFYVMQEINERTTGFVELVFEADDSGGFETDVERLWIRYEASEAFQIAGGRFHTPLGYWNRTYHHGNLIQDTVDRPFFLDFEDDENGIMPIHLVGLMVSGETWAGLGTLRYELVVGNGQELSSEAGLDPASEDKPELDPNNFDDKNNDKSLGGRLSLRSDKGWQFGLFGMTQAIAEGGSRDNGALAATGESLVDQTIFGIDLRYEAERFGFLGEYFDIRNDVSFDAAGSHSATAFYAQAWFDWNDKWRLSYRFSSLDRDEGDPFFRLLAVEGQEHDVLTLGFRRDEVSVIKIEVDRLEAGVSGLGDATIFRAQWAFLIP